MTTAADAIARTHREEWARIVAAIARRFGGLDIAEDSAAEAFAAAAARWSSGGVPPNPAGWLMTTAQRKAIDRLRREAVRDDRHREALLLHDDSPAEPVGAIDDDRLRLVFVCCHPVLALEARVALTLRIVGGLTVVEIAHAFLVPSTTMGQRITRAKAKIAAARVPYRVPEADDLPERVAGVLAVLYLIFNEGYLASGAESEPLRRDLSAEAIRLTRLVRELLPGDPEVEGLLALMMLTEARADARVSRDGELVRLDEQDRGSWDRRLIDEGLALVRGHDDASARGDGAPGRYQLLAAINAVHVSAPTARDTEWGRIVSLYTRLEQIDPSPIVTLNKAIAVAQYDSPDVALAMLERLADSLDAHHAFHASRAELLRLAGRSLEAHAAYERAITLAGNSAEVAHLVRRRDQLSDPLTDSRSTGIRSTDAHTLADRPTDTDQTEDTDTRRNAS